MKIALATIAFGVALCSFRVSAQTGASDLATNLPSSLDISIASPLFDTLKQGSNIFAVPFMTYDLDTRDVGGGVAIGTKISPYVAGIVRLESLKGQFFSMQADLQLQADFTISRAVTFTPFTFAGAAVPFSWKSGNGSQTGNPIGVIGAGAALHTGSGSRWLPADVVADIERWTGSGWNDNTVRLGALWKF